MSVRAIAHDDINIAIALIIYSYIYTLDVEYLMTFFQIRASPYARNI
jgi:hypothetical protein